MELLLLMKWSFKINLEHKSQLPLMESNIVVRKIYVEVDQERKGALQRQQQSHKMLTKFPLQLLSYHTCLGNHANH